MQASPSPLYRTSFSVTADNQNRRVSRAPPRSSTRRSVKTSQLLLAGLATSAARTWVLDDHPSHASPGGGSGGGGWILLGFWTGRVIIDLREQWKGRKGKRREDVDDALVGRARLTLAVLLAVQSISFVLSLQVLGPLRTVIALCFTSMLPKSAPTSLPALLPLLPVFLSLLVALWTPCSTIPVKALIPPAVLLASSYAHGNPRLWSLSTKKSHTAPRGHASRYLASAEGAACTAVFTVVLWLAGFITTPFSAAHDHETAFALLSFLAAAMANYLPIPSDAHALTLLATTRGRTVILASIFALQFFALPPRPDRYDALLVLPLALVSELFIGDSASSTTHRRRASDIASAISSSVGWSAMVLVPVKWRPHLRTILNTPSSSRIFYFLLLNLAYMGVQMGYGVLTNSLGLISDAIHMFFDCLGIGMGLWASVMATWKPDGRYTFGYSRVETLSGFANGCFLLLISVFIIFEAIQRVIDPPEMDTHQLLLVSSIGLLINLFGMWATGGHHHHGHGHGHDHHSHSVPVNDKKVDHRISNGHTSHDHSHSGGVDSHGHSHSSGTRWLMDKTQHMNDDVDLHVRRRSSGLTNGGATGTEFTNDLGPLANGDIHAADSHPHEHQHHQHCHGEEPHHPHHEHSDQHDCAHHDHDHDHHHDHAHDHDTHDHRDPAHIHDSDHYVHHDSHSHHDDHTHVDHHHHSEHSNGHSAHHHHHSHNMRGVFLHVMADTLGSVGVIVSTILIKFTGWTGFDPIASLFIAALIMASVIPLVIDAGKMLCLDVGADQESDIRAALAELSSIDGLANYGAPRFWPRCEGELVGSIHIHLAPSAANHDPSHFSQTPYKSRQPTIYANAEKVVSRVEKVLKGRISGLEELVVQVEGADEKSYCSCMTGVR